MASFATAKAAIERIRSIPGLQARMQQRQSPNSTQAFNNILVRDMRPTAKRSNKATEHNGAAHPDYLDNPVPFDNSSAGNASPGPSGIYGWQRYEVGTSTFFPDANAIFV